MAVSDSTSEGGTDLTTLIAALNSMTQVLGQSSRTLTSILNDGFIAARHLHIAGAGTFQASGPVGSILSVNINTGAAGATVTIYDSATTASLPGSLVVANLTLTATDPGSVPIGPSGRGLTLNSGLVVVTTGAVDITVGFE